jgi:hypothetical protein
MSFLTPGVMTFGPSGPSSPIVGSGGGATGVAFASTVSALVAIPKATFAGTDGLHFAHTEHSLHSSTPSAQSGHVWFARMGTASISPFTSRSAVVAPHPPHSNMGEACFFLNIPASGCGDA